MVRRIARIFSGLDLEEKILNGAVLFGLISVFFPWLSGEWLGGEQVLYTGFQFYTSFVGIVIFLLLLAIIAIGIAPIVGGYVLVRQEHRDIVRLLLASLATILTLASLSVLTKVTYEFARIEIRFGVYFTLVGCLVASVYAFMRWQDQRRREVREIFHHPDDPVQQAVQRETVRMQAPPPPPPPPAPSEPEEHRIRP